MPGERYLTQDHDVIRKWAEDRGGKASTVGTTRSDTDPGLIRLDFPGYSGEGDLEEISWDDWFRKFDENKLVLLYQEETSSGQKSNFNKLIREDTARDAESNAEWVEPERR